MHDNLFQVGSTVGLDVASLAKVDDIFTPVAPLFVVDEAAGDAPPQRHLVDSAAALREHRRSLLERLETVGKSFRTAERLLSAHEARLCILIAHAQSIVADYRDAVNFVENLLRKQLAAAIGKEARRQPILSHSLDFVDRL